MQCALDPRKARDAFGDAGGAAFAAAYQLCQSLAQHWTAHDDVHAWRPPFEGARLAAVSAFSASSASNGMAFALDQYSSLHALMAAYELAAKAKTGGIVQRVRSRIAANVRSKHLAPRFDRRLQLEHNVNMRVDFLGHRFACYFLQASTAERGVDEGALRGLGLMSELQALQRFAAMERRTIDLLDEERPQHFELIVVGSAQHPTQRRVIAKIEALADSQAVLMRAVDDVSAAAERVYEREAA